MGKQFFVCPRGTNHTPVFYTVVNTNKRILSTVWLPAQIITRGLEEDHKKKILIYFDIKNKYQKISIPHIQHDNKDQ